MNISCVYPELWAPNLLLAGERDTHGGGAIVCTDSHTNKINYIALLDLWEGENFNHYKYPKTDGNIDIQLQSIFTRMTAYTDPIFLSKLKKYVEKIRSEVLWINPLKTNIAINPPSDALNGFIKKGCELKGLASFQSSPQSKGQLWVDMLLFNKKNFPKSYMPKPDTSNVDNSYKLPDFHKAALFIHEAIYKILRDEMGVQNSILARRITANLLAVNAKDRYFSGETYICSDIFAENNFYVSKQWTKRYKYEGQFVTRLHMINAYSETLHPDTIIDFKEIAIKDFFTIHPKFSIKLMGRSKNAVLNYYWKKCDTDSRYPDDRCIDGYNLKNVSRDFEKISCYKRDDSSY